MAMSRLVTAAAALVVLALGASAARQSDIGRGLKQSVSVDAASPAVSLDISAGPFSGFLTRMVAFLRNDASMLRADVANTASSLNSTVAGIPLVATFESDLASGLQAAEHNLNTAVSNGQAAGQGVLDNLNVILSNLLTGGNSILHDAEAALPPVPMLPAGLMLPAGMTLPAGLPIVSVPMPKGIRRAWVPMNIIAICLLLDFSAPGAGCLILQAEAYQREAALN